jgi:hypothetical protein
LATHSLLLQIVTPDGRICWVVVVFAIVVGAHALHPKRDRCPLLVSKRLCLVVNKEVTGRWADSLCVRRLPTTKGVVLRLYLCVDARRFTAEASLARLEQHGLVPTRGEAVQAHFAGLSDDQVASCGGDEVKLKVLMMMMMMMMMMMGRRGGGEEMTKYITYLIQ